MKYYLVLLSFSVLFLHSCLKDKVPSNECISTFIDINVEDTIFPKEYFPAKPGSYWVFDNGDSITSESWEKVTIYKPLGDSYCGFIERRTAVVPKINKYFDFVWGDQGVINITEDSLGNRIYPYFQDQVGAIGIEKYYWDAIDEYVKFQVGVIDKFDSVKINSITYYDVIKVSSGIYKTGKYGDYCTHPIFYLFAKNIGIIQINRLPYQEDIYYNLVDYYLAP